MSEPPTSHENVENGLFSLACGRAEFSSVTSSTANRQCSLGTGRPPQRGIATGVDTSPFTGVRSCHIRIPSFSEQRGGQESGARYSAHRHIHRGAPVQPSRPRNRIPNAFLRNNFLFLSDLASDRWKHRFAPVDDPMTIGTAFSGRSGKPTTCTLRLVGRHRVALADSAVLQVQLQTGFKTDFAVFDSQYRLPRAVHRDQIFDRWLDGSCS
jgi:hypothetical protein